MTRSLPIKFCASLFVISAWMFLVSSSGCRRKDEQEKKITRIPVQTAWVEKVEMARKIHTYGRLSSEKEIKLSFKTGGIIKKIYADEGQEVKKGQTLASLDLSEIKAQVDQAQSAFLKAERDLKRVEQLYQEKAATLEQYQDIKTAFNIAESRLKIAEFNLHFSEIRAPVEGAILKRLMEEDELAAAGYPVFLLAAPGNDWVIRAGISDKDLVRIQMMDPATIVFDAYPGIEFQAVVTEIAESSDPRSGTYEIELKLESSEKKMATGFVAEIDITPSQKEIYAVIPIEALVEAEENRGYVYTIKNSSFALRIPIKIAFIFENKVAVSSGLEGIETVITEGAPYLQDGTEVDIVHNDSREREKNREDQK